MYENNDSQNTNQVFGFDASFNKESASVTLPKSAFGYPLSSLEDILSSDSQSYLVQAEYVQYKLVERINAPPTYLPVSCVSKAGSNGSYEKPDGTIYSNPVPYKAGEETNLDLLLTNIIPDSTPNSRGCAGLGDGIDSDYIKTVRIKSSLLADFYKNSIDTTLEACVLLPLGFHHEAHRNAKYPLVVSHGHYNPTFNPGGEFRKVPPDCDITQNEDYDCIAETYAYYLFKNWTSEDDGMPFAGARVLLVTLNHPVPFFDDSYAVDSENMGPYGEAITTELIPAIEKQYRGLGEGWARGLMGGSTGGWESAAYMILYPDMFGYSLAACPDSVTFTHHTSVNIYENDNAYYYNSNFKKTPTPGYRDGYSGHTIGYKMCYGDVISTFGEMNHRELALGENSLSCGQFDAWEAVWSPIDPDTGYPKRIYDKETGVIDKEVANHWSEKYDLAKVLVKKWDQIGHKVKGRLHFAVGGSDSFYLNNAVFDFQQLLLANVGPDHGISFTYGAHDEGLGFQHCFRGYEYDADGSPLPNSITRLTYAQDVIPRMVETWLKYAPNGADVDSWRY